MTAHGAPIGVDETTVPQDFDLAMVGGDMYAWLEAHPCECEGICECEGAPRSVD